MSQDLWKAAEFVRCLIKQYHEEQGDVNTNPGHSSGKVSFRVCLFFLKIPNFKHPLEHH